MRLENLSLDDTDANNLCVIMFGPVLMTELQIRVLSVNMNCISGTALVGLVYFI